MDPNQNPTPGIGTLVARLVRTAVGTLQNRFELLALEWQEERIRLTELLFWSVALVFFSMMGVMLVTATVIFLFTEEYRVYVAGAFAVLYVIAAAVAFMTVKSGLKREPFAETIDQAKKDKEWLKSFE